MLVSSINVYFRDMEHLISVSLMALYFLTPVMYDITAMPAHLQKMMFLNPMTAYVLMYRDVTFNGYGIDLKMLLFAAVYSAAVLAGGYVIFERLQRKFTEVL